MVVGLRAGDREDKPRDTSTWEWTCYNIVNDSIHQVFFLNEEDFLQEISTLASELSSIGSNLDPAINCHPGVLQAG